MDESELELRKVIDAAMQSSIETDGISSILELYEQRKAELKLSDNLVAKLLEMDKKTLIPILQGTGKHIDFINIIKLAHFLNLSVSDLIKIYVPKMSTKQIGEIQRAREAGYIFSNIDVASLKKLGFFKGDATITDLAERIKKFFDLSSIYSYSENQVFSVFSISKNDSNALIRNFWVQSAFKQFSLINNPNKFDRKALVDLIPKIKPYTRNLENGLLLVSKALYMVGVTVIFQPSISTLQIKGATFFCCDKPCIVLSDLNKHYPTLWFVLLHELHHVLYDFDEIRKRTFHLSGEGDLFLMNEEKADDFAREYLLSDSMLRYISGYIYSKPIVEKFAKEYVLHPSIIYAIYCYKTKEWKNFSKEIPKMDVALKLLNTHPFEKVSLIESVIEIKEQVYNI